MNAKANDVLPECLQRLEEGLFRRRDERRGIALPFLESPPTGHDLMIMNPSPELTDRDIENGALAALDFDLP